MNIIDRIELLRKGARKREIALKGALGMAVEEKEFLEREKERLEKEVKGLREELGRVKGILREVAGKYPESWGGSFLDKLRRAAE